MNKAKVDVDVEVGEEVEGGKKGERIEKQFPISINGNVNPRHSSPSFSPSTILPSYLDLALFYQSHQL